MKIILTAFGGKHDLRLVAAVEDYSKRLSFYYPVEWNLLHPVKNASRLDPAGLVAAESQMLLSQLQENEFLVLLDEKGKMLSSPELAGILEKQSMVSKRIRFVIGGAYGVSEALLQKADMIWSLSKLVFPHQLVRLILAEQLYRACTIIKGEKYHHV